MCLSIPSKIKSIDTEMNTCVVDTMGVERSASLDLIDQDVKVGVLCFNSYRFCYE